MIYVWHSRVINNDPEPLRIAGLWCDNAPMMDWDDLRFFLAVARSGSIRAAATVLAVNHATVSRRISGLEQRLGVRLFEKLPTGYVVTPASEEIFELAEQMEAQANAIERRIYGRDAGLTGKLRVTLPQVLATDLIMPDLVSFTRLHPGIELELITSYETLNLTKRQADVAIRLVYADESPPEHLYGRKLVSVHRAVYVSNINVDSEAPGTVTAWIKKEEDGQLPNWATGLGPAQIGRDYIVSDVLVQRAAAQEGLGASLLLCFSGDPDSKLRRLPPGDSQAYGDLWILTHGDLRHTPRVRAFTEFIAAAIRSKRDLMEGRMATL